MSGCQAIIENCIDFRTDAFYNLQGIEMKAKMKGFMLENRIIAHLIIGFMILLVLATSGSGISLKDLIIATPVPGSGENSSVVEETVDKSVPPQLQQNGLVYDLNRQF